VWGLGARPRSSFVVEVPAASNATVMVRFTLVAQGAHQVAVAGDFNGWDPKGTVLVNQDGQGNFVGTLNLPPGAHEYMFVVDGKWVTDPAASELRPDGFGRTNAILRL
jgi:1,4-alpha-glucan branching enzyme